MIPHGASTPLRGRTLDGSGLPSRSAWLITWVVLGGAFCVSFTITILSVSRPAIAKSLGADTSDLVWLISGPVMAGALVAASAGKLGDLRGHRRVYLLAMAGATLFAALSAVASSAGMLIAFRVLGALVGAATAPSSMAIINLLFAPQQRSRPLGFWSLVVAGGPVVGLVAGGPLVDAFGWRMIFILQTPLLALAALAAWWLLPETVRRPDARFDIAGQVALAVALFGVLFAIDRGRVWGWGSAGVLALLVAAVVALAMFVVIERRVAEPLVPLRYFSRRDFSLPVALQFFTNFGYMGGFILAPKLLDEVRGLSAGQISLLLIPRPLVFAICGPLAGALIPRWGTRVYALVGTLCMTVSLGAMAAVAPNPATGVVVAAIALSGIGMGSFQPAVATSVANSVEHEDLGVAGATQQLVGQVGASVGMNLLDSFQVARLGSGLPESFAQAYLLGVAVSAVGVGLALRLRSAGARGGGRRAEDREESEEVRAQMVELP